MTASAVTGTTEGLQNKTSRTQMEILEAEGTQCAKWSGAIVGRVVGVVQYMASRSTAFASPHRLKQICYSSTLTPEKDTPKDVLKDFRCLGLGDRKIKTYCHNSQSQGGHSSLAKLF